MYDSETGAEAQIWRLMKKGRQASLPKIGRHFNRDQRSWWIKMVSSGLFHPSEVANIYQVIIVIEAACRCGACRVNDQVGVVRTRRKPENANSRNNQKQTLTLTTLSHPAETMTGLAGLGENRTHETLKNDPKVSLCPTSPSFHSMRWTVRSTHHSE